MDFILESLLGPKGGGAASPPAPPLLVWPSSYYTAEPGSPSDTGALLPLAVVAAGLGVAAVLWLLLRWLRGGANGVAADEACLKEKNAKGGAVEPEPKMTRPARRRRVGGSRSPEPKPEPEPYLVEDLGKFTNAPYDQAVFRPWDESNYKQVYVHGPASQYKDGSVSQRTTWLKESLVTPAICVDFETVRIRRGTELLDGTTFAEEVLTDPDEMAVYLWTMQDGLRPPAYTAEGVYKRTNHALLCDDPDWLGQMAYFMHAVARYIVSHPAETAVKLYRGTRIEERQKVPVDKAGGVGGRVFRQPMFVAVSESEAVAATFTAKGSPILEFEVPAGCCSCAKIPERLSMFPAEAEWLMPPYTPVEWQRQEDRTFARGEVRLVVTFKVLDGRVVSQDPQYAGANAPRTCMIMCEIPRDLDVQPRSRSRSTATGPSPRHAAAPSPSRGRRAQTTGGGGRGGGGARRGQSRRETADDFRYANPTEDLTGPLARASERYERYKRRTGPHDTSLGEESKALDSILAIGEKITMRTRGGVFDGDISDSDDDDTLAARRAQNQQPVPEPEPEPMALDVKEFMPRNRSYELYERLASEALASTKKSKGEEEEAARLTFEVVEAATLAADEQAERARVAAEEDEAAQQRSLRNSLIIAERNSVTEQLKAVAALDPGAQRVALQFLGSPRTSMAEPESQVVNASEAEVARLAAAEVAEQERIAADPEPEPESESESEPVRPAAAALHEMKETEETECAEYSLEELLRGELVVAGAAALVLDTENIIELGALLAEAVAELHASYSDGASSTTASRHLDIRATSVFITMSETVDSANAVGLKRTLQWNRVRLSKVSVFSPVLAENWEYMAPEVAAWAVEIVGAANFTRPGVGAVGVAADVFALGVLLWQLWHGRGGPRPRDGFADCVPKSRGGEEVALWLAQGSRPSFRYGEQPHESQAAGSDSEHAVRLGWMALVRSCWRGAARERPSAADVAAALRQLQTDPSMVMSDGNGRIPSAPTTPSVTSQTRRAQNSVLADQRERHEEVSAKLGQWAAAVGLPYEGVPPTAGSVTGHGQLSPRERYI